jgi:hypothetical protein
MMQDAHKALEAMSRAASAVKDERWSEAARSLHEVQQLTTTLMRQVGDKQAVVMGAPKSDKGDRE